VAKGATKIFDGMGFKKIGRVSAKNAAGVGKHSFFQAVVAGPAPISAFEIFDPDLVDLRGALLVQLDFVIQSPALRRQLLWGGVGGVFLPVFKVTFLLEQQRFFSLGKVGLVSLPRLIDFTK
jgi:hypothetical protein